MPVKLVFKLISEDTKKEPIIAIGSFFVSK